MNVSYMLTQDQRAKDYRAEQQKEVEIYKGRKLLCRFNTSVITPTIIQTVVEAFIREENHAEIGDNNQTGRKPE